MNSGQVVQLSALLEDGAGNPLSNVVLTYTATGAVQVSNAGLVCAGTWDSLTTPVICTPHVLTGGSADTGTVTVTSASITTTVNAAVHTRIARVTIATTPPPGPFFCNSQTETQQFSAQAFDSNNNLIPPAQVGTFVFTSSNTASVSIDANGLATSLEPGGAFITASANSVFSVPVIFSSCQPLSIVVAPSTAVSLAAAGTQQLTPTVTDTKGNPITGTSLVLSYLSSDPAVASVSTTGLITGVGAGSTGVIAACSPPSCNGGANANIPVYSNLVPVTVSGTSSATVYVTGATSTTIVPISTSTNTAGTAITIPQNNSVQPKINSFMINKAGTKGYLGTDKSLLVLDTAANTVSASSTNTPGTVLAISPDGLSVIYADQSASPKTYVYDTSTDTLSATTLTTFATTSASFSPDSLKAYLINGGEVWAASGALAPPFLRLVSGATTAQDAIFLSQGSLGYVAGNPANGITAYSTCDNSAVVGGSLGFSANPLKITSSFDSTRVFAIDASHIDDVTVSGIGTPANQNCPAIVTQSSMSVPIAGGPFTPNQLFLTSDGKNLFATTPTNQLLHYDTIAHTTSIITLSGGTAITTGGATLDGQNVYVGATGTNDVHRISVASGTDSQQIIVSLKDTSSNAVSPDFVAVQPK